MVGRGVALSLKARYGRICAKRSPRGSKKWKPCQANNRGSDIRLTKNKRLSMSNGERSKDAAFQSAVALSQAGSLDEAWRALQQCSANDDEVVRLTLFLAGALADRGRIQESLPLYERAIAARPNLAPARQNLAALRLQMGDYEAAIAESRAALALLPAYPLALNTLGVALAHRGRMEEAINALMTALRANPNYAEAACNVGNVLARCGRREEAIAAYRRALEIDPRLDHVAFDLAALGAAAPPPQMPRSYLTTFFNNYAPRFDRHMEALRYVAPRLLANAVLTEGSQQFDEAVDLGCGTGLVGALFRPHVRHFVGVDLADSMIAASRQRGIYDELANEDVVDYLRRRETPVDLLLAADVLIYFGDLEDLFAAASARMRGGGRFAFSIEATENCDYWLQPSRRYAHSPNYIRRLAAGHQWAELVSQECCLRDQPDGRANGVVFVFRAAA
jgi:predicted TPR repeat methyltransferase